MEFSLFHTPRPFLISLFEWQSKWKPDVAKGNGARAKQKERSQGSIKKKTVKREKERKGK